MVTTLGLALTYFLELSMSPVATSPSSPAAHSSPINMSLSWPVRCVIEACPFISKYVLTGSPSRTTCRTTCTACGSGSRVIFTIKAPCGHDYCQGCIADLFKSAMTDETLMPPRCCGTEIPIPMVERLLGSDVIVQFKEKMGEFSTKNRLYCPIATCSAFIGEASSIEGDLVNCPKCGAEVCAYCKTVSHSISERCSDDNDSAFKLVLELGESEGWRRCGGCRRLVELDYGWCVYIKFTTLPRHLPSSHAVNHSFHMTVSITCKFDSEYKTFFLTVFSSVYANTNSAMSAVRNVSVFSHIART